MAKIQDRANIGKVIISPQKEPQEVKKWYVRLHPWNKEQ